MCAWECKTWYIWNPLARGAVHKQTLRAALLEFQLVANSLFFLYSTFLALSRTMDLPSGNLLQCFWNSVIFVCHAPSLGNLKQSHLTRFINAGAVLTYAIPTNVSKTRDGVWHWSTAWFVFIFSVFTGWQVENSLPLSSFPPLKLCILTLLHHWRSTAASKEGEDSIAESYTYKKEQGVWVKNKGFSRC